ncbi:hypothetical protein CHH28_07140 [Bacterioplanes sanyensis]|uniref:G8 domain-containing protein n=2 Tax=Bacterioplanes sanyensis TaxID=1249553 RepID=A0A222FI75_9GAMM|nr:hypothetical protein CHH28_07140 [Bacterioplanes sanyensis]
MMTSLPIVSLDQVTHEATTSGAWSDSATWKQGSIPSSGARVYIPQGVTVQIENRIRERLKTVRIDGKLSFNPALNTELLVDTLVTTASGELEIGTKQTPIQASVTARVIIIDDGAIDRSWDTELISRGLILMGKTTLFGHAKTGFESVASFPRAGDTTLNLKTIPTGWEVGDSIVIAGTDPIDPSSDETAIITAIDGMQIVIDAPLTRGHVAPKSDLEVHVANLTRNIQITSENPTIDRRGHVMVMHNNNASINYASFNKLGRVDKTKIMDDLEFTDLDPKIAPTLLGGTNVRGRYSLHFHKGGTNKNSSPAVVHGSVVTDDPGWGFVNHSSHVNFSNNVTHNIVGAAYYTEAGDEIGSFINNIAIRTVNPNDPLKSLDELDPDSREHRQDYGFQGDGFWFHGPNVTVTGNIVSGASGHAYIWWPEGLLEKANDGSTIKIFHDTANVPNGNLIGPDGTKMQIFDVPIGKFENNQAYSTTRGIQVFYLHTDFFGDGVHLEDGIPYPSPSYYGQLRSTISSSTLWNIEETAVDIPYVNRITLNNLRLVGYGGANTVGVDAAHFQNLTGIQLVNLNIENFETAMQVTTTGEVTIDGGTYSDNKTDIQYITPTEDD